MRADRAGYKKNKLGWIPDEWDVVELGDVIEFLTGLPFSSEKFKDNGIRLLRCANIKRGNTDWSENITQHWEKLTPELKQYEMLSGDIVIAMDGSLVGRSFARLTEKDIPSLLVQRVARVRSSSVDMGYLKETICSTYFTRYCDAVKTVTAIPHISPKDIRSYTIPLPPLAEQQKIADILCAVDEKIEAIDAEIAETEQLKKGLMQKLLTEGIGHTEFKDTKLGSIPVDWEVKKFKDETAILTCGVAATPKYVEEDIGIPFLSAQNVRNGKVVLDKYKFITKELHQELTKNHKPVKGDILYSRVGAKFGEAGVVEHDFEFSVYVSLTHIRVKESSDPYFIKSLLNSNFVKRMAYNSVYQGAGVPNLNVKVVREFKLAFPPLPEQKKIAAILTSVDDKIEILQQKRAENETLKKGLMQKLLTGEMRVRV